MTFLRALKFLYLPSIFISIVCPTIVLLFAWLFDSLNVSVNDSFQEFWISGISATVLYLLLIEFRFRIFTRNTNEKAWGFNIFPIAFQILIGVSAHQVYWQSLTKVKSVTELTAIDKEQKHTVWHYQGDFEPNSQIYYGNYTEYSSGKHPKTGFISYAVINVNPANMWLVIRDEESISNSSSESEKVDVYNHVQQKNINKSQQLVSNKIHDHFFIPIGENEDVHYALRTLDDLEYKGKTPNHFFRHEAFFEKGIQNSTIVMLLIGLGGNLLFCLIVSLFAKRKHLHAIEESPIINLNGVQWLSVYPRKAPITSMIIIISILFLFIEIINEPNIFTVKSDPYISRWMVFKPNFEMNGWHCLFTYPFTNFFLWNKIIDPLLFVVVSFEIERRTNKLGFILMLFCAQIAGGFAAIYFDDTPNSGLTVFTFALIGYYILSGIQKNQVFDKWRQIGLTILVFGFFLCYMTGFLQYPKLIAGTLVGFVFATVLKFRTTHN